MKSTQAHLWSIFRNVLHLASYFAAVWIGYQGVHALPGSFISLALIMGTYVFARYPQMARAWATDPVKARKLFLLQLAGSYIFATALHWIGHGLARHF